MGRLNPGCCDPIGVPGDFAGNDCQLSDPASAAKSLGILAAHGDDRHGFKVAVCRGRGHLAALVGGLGTIRDGPPGFAKILSVVGGRILLIPDLGDDLALALFDGFTSRSRNIVTRLSIAMVPAGSDFRALALIGTAVGEMVLPILLGIWLDERFGWSPYGLMAGASVGVVGGMTHLIMMSRRSGSSG